MIKELAEKSEKQLTWLGEDTVIDITFLVTIGKKS